MTEGTEGRRGFFPLARSEDLLVEQVGDETVIYDGRSKEAHCLGPLAAAVFAAADGRASVADLAGTASARLGDSVEVARVEQALAELEERDLLVAPTGDGISRRHFVRKTAVVGGAVWATPLVLSSQAFGASFGNCPNCPTGRLFALRIESSNCGCADFNPANDCLEGTTTDIATNCGCLIPRFVTVTCSGSENSTHTFTLQPGVQFCGAAGKAGSGATECEGTTVTVTPNANGTTTVTVENPPPQALSHSDIVVCLRGSPPSCTGT